MTAATDADTKTVWLSELSGYWNLRASVDSASQGRSPRSHPFTAVPIACSDTALHALLVSGKIVIVSIACFHIVYVLIMQVEYT